MQNKTPSELISDLVNKTISKLFVLRIGIIENLKTDNVLLVDITLVDKEVIILNGESVESEPIVLIDVPLIRFANTIGGFEVPIAIGDEVSVLFTDIDIKNWFLNGGRQFPKTNLTHNPNSCIAFIGIGNQKKSYGEYNNTQTRAFYENTEMILTDKIEMQNLETNIINVLDKVNNLLEAVKNTTILDSNSLPCTINPSEINTAQNQFEDEYNKLFK